MPITISPIDQEEVNQVRIDLAQAMLDLAFISVHPSDAVSREAKENAQTGLRAVRSGLDRLGFQHACARKSKV